MFDGEAAIMVMRDQEHVPVKLRNNDKRSCAINGYLKSLDLSNNVAEVCNHLAHVITTTAKYDDGYHFFGHIKHILGREEVNMQSIGIIAAMEYGKPDRLEEPQGDEINGVIPNQTPRRMISVKSTKSTQLLWKLGMMVYI